MPRAKLKSPTTKGQKRIDDFFIPFRKSSQENSTKQEETSWMEMAKTETKAQEDNNVCNKEDEEDDFQDSDVEFIEEIKPEMKRKQEETLLVNSSVKTGEEDVVFVEEEKNARVFEREEETEQDSPPLCMIAQVRTIHMEEFQDTSSTNQVNNKAKIEEEFVLESKQGVGQASEEEETTIVEETWGNGAQDDERLPDAEEFVADLVEKTKKLPKKLGVSTSTPKKLSERRASGENEASIDREYFVRIFRKIVDRVRNDEFHAELFSTEDRNIFEWFDRLSENGRHCFVRMFNRQNGWTSAKSFTKSLEKYFSSSEELGAAFGELLQWRFVDSIESCKDVEEMLNMLSAPVLKQFVSKYSNIHQMTRKKELIADFIKDVKSQNAVCGNRLEKLLPLLRAKLTSFFRMNENVRRLFTAVFHLYSLQEMSAQNLAAGNVRRNLPSQLIFKLLQKERGETQYPNRRGIRKEKVFNDREELVEYVKANELYAEVLDAFVEKHDFDKCIEIGEMAKAKFASLDKKFRLKSSLRRFSSIYVYWRCVFYGVQALQRCKRYDEAVADLVWLLENVDCKLTSKRGEFYERLCINYKEHLKDHEKAFEVVEAALKDPSVKDSWKVGLIEKGQRLANVLDKRDAKLANVGRRKRKRSLGNNDESSDVVGQVWAERLANLQMQFPTLNQYRIKTIRCPLLSKNLGGRRKTLFVNGDAVDVPVEEMAIRDYKTAENFTEGIHDEGRTLKSLMGLILWDSFYDVDVDDVWQCSQQLEPLDLDETRFVDRRGLLSGRLMKLNFETEETISAWIEESWNKHFGTASSLVSWNDFADVEQAKSLALCVGGKRMSCIFYYLLEDFKARRSGFPDLTLWNFDTRRFKVVEVKGPGDTLSNTQKIWLSTFDKFGVEAELCKVEGENVKRLHPANESGSK